MEDHSLNFKLVQYNIHNY